MVSLCDRADEFAQELWLPSTEVLPKFSLYTQWKSQPSKSELEMQRFSWSTLQKTYSRTSIKSIPNKNKIYTPRLEQPNLLMPKYNVNRNQWRKLGCIQAHGAWQMPKCTEEWGNPPTCSSQEEHNTLASCHPPSFGSQFPIAIANMHPATLWSLGFLIKI